MRLEDGRGSGRSAGVNTEGRLLSQAVTETSVEHANRHEAACWTIPFDALAPSGANWFFAVTNNGDSDLVIALLNLHSTAAGVFRIARVTGTPAGGTAILPRSLYLGSLQLPSISCQGGADLTGLTEADLLIPQYVPANMPAVLDCPSRVIVPSGVSFAIKAPGAATVNGNLLVYVDTSAE